MKKTAVILTTLMILCVTSVVESARIKDVATVSGARENQLIGYGLVVGLNKTGDNYNKTRFSIQTLVSMLEKLGTTVDISRLGDLRVRNVAAVMVTATLPPFARPGVKIDTHVSSLGDASSLEGGTLILTPLKGPNGEVYAVAQGPISVGGAFQVGKHRNRIQKNHSTVGKISGGAIVERGVRLSFEGKEELELLLNDSDFTTAMNMVGAINEVLGEVVATPLDSGSVRVKVPDSYKGRIVELVAKIEATEVGVDTPAKVVLDERTGTIVVGEKVRLLASAISHGNLTITIKERPEIIQPPAIALGTTPVAPPVDMEVTEKKEKLLYVPSTTNIQELVKALNGMGVTPRDLIAIFQSLKAAGALQAELEII